MRVKDKKTIFPSVFLLISLHILFGCSRPISSGYDENQIRKEFSLPSDVRLVHMWRSSDQPGTFGREGLHIVAKFKFSESQLRQFIQEAENNRWESLPIAETVDNFQDPPEELPKNIKNGLYFCMVWCYGEWKDGKRQESITKSCKDTPEKFDHYRTGILDIDTGKMVIVCKN